MTFINLIRSQDLLRFNRSMKTVFRNRIFFISVPSFYALGAAGYTVMCICFEFSLDPSVVYVCCDWPLVLVLRHSIDHIRILTVGINRGSCGGIFSNANIFDDIPSFAS